MDSIVITWREVLLLLVGVLAVYVAEMLLLLRRGSLPGWRFWQRVADTQAQTRALMEVRREVETLARDLAALREEVRQAARVVPAGKTAPGAATAPIAPAPPSAVPPPNLPPGSAYAEAIRLARAGYPAAALVRDCGLSRGEADLIHALYGTPPA
jgi:hypothetical protein